MQSVVGERRTPRRMIPVRTVVVGAMIVASLTAGAVIAEEVHEAGSSATAVATGHTLWGVDLMHRAHPRHPTPARVAEAEAGVTSLGLSLDPNGSENPGR